MANAEQTVSKAFAILDQIAAVLDGAGDTKAQGAALKTWRMAHAAEMTALTAEIRSMPLETLRPFIEAERDKHGQTGATIEKARASDDEQLVAEIVAVSDLFGGPR